MTDQANIIRLSRDEFEKLYENFGSSHFQIQSQVLSEYGIKQVDIYFKSMGFATTVVVTIGVIAGFGFTALAYVNSLYLFFTGEVLLLGGIYYGLLWVQRIYQSEYSSIDRERKKFKNFYDSRNEKFMKLYDSWMANETINKGDLKDLNDMDIGSLEFFKTNNEAISKIIYPLPTYWLMVVGTVLLLASFIF